MASMEIGDKAGFPFDEAALEAQTLTNLDALKHRSQRVSLPILTTYFNSLV